MNKTSVNAGGKANIVHSHVMCKAAEVGKIVINECLDRGIFINTQKLQKLLTLMQVECIRRSDKPLFKESIHRWNSGVAIPEVDVELSFGTSSFTARQQEYIVLLDKERESVNYILDQFGHMDSFELNKLPTNQKIARFCVSNEDNTEPFVCWQVLLGAFHGTLL